MYQSVETFRNNLEKFNEIDFAYFCTIPVHLSSNINCSLNIGHQKIAIYQSISEHAPIRPMLSAVP